MRGSTVLSLLVLPTLWLTLAACGQVATSSAQAPSTVIADSPAPLLRAHTLSATSGQVAAWGWNNYGQTNVPALPAGMTYTAVAGAESHSLALRSDGHIVAWGFPLYGQSNVPALPGGVTYTAVAEGAYHSLALRSDGQAVAWGYSPQGQLNVPTLPAGMTYTAVAGGGYHSLALRSDGQAVGWGDNRSGQATVPALPTGLTYTAVAAGYYHSLMLRSDGQVVVWGDNFYGQSKVPALPAGMTYTAVAAGFYHSLALRSDGRIIGWGRNTYGQADPPWPPTGMTYTAVAGGLYHGLALRSDGRVIGWGINNYSQLNVPALPAGTIYTAVAAGGNHSLAIQSINTPPTAPSAPTFSAGTNPNNTGSFTLSWTPGTDAQQNALTYTMEGQSSAPGAAWTTIASRVTSPTLALTGVAEGTWTYRVHANDGIVDGPTSDPSTPIKVDRSAPTAPTVQVNGAAPTGSWYKDSVSIAFLGSTDPALADTTAGSGVASYQGAETVTSSGTTSYSGTATDAVGNVSAATTGSVKVDATPPSVAFDSCPATVSLGTAQSLSWTASDGESGLSSASTGSVTLPSSTLGPQTVTTTATDAVGHTTTASCTFSSIYAFRGFLAPVENLPVMNVIKAGITIPLRFSLSGNWGLGILAAGSPSISKFTCATGAPTRDLGTPTTSKNSGLAYDASSDTYTYVWKTDKSMVGCYQVNVKLTDGTSHLANFQMK